MDSQNTAWLMADYISTQSIANRINEKLKQTNDLSAFFEEEFKEKGISIFDQEV